ncbi:MAG: recombination mediator RecR [Bifidobacteriaceae bacterium]|nr:recombination mediator RecR [Bifidobacteriaceae bacterium]
MALYDGALQNVIDAFAALPGIGPKGAQRVAFYLLSADDSQVQNLAESIVELKRKIRFCDICGNICESSPCAICSDPRRDSTQLCVVQEAKDVMTIEGTHEFHGLYHVLGGAINPMSGVRPQDLRVAQLVKRLGSHGALTIDESMSTPQSSGGIYSSAAPKASPASADESQDSQGAAMRDVPPVQEVILALNPDIEGDATATYLSGLLSSTGITVTKLASGLPVGSDLEYADEMTLARALAGRRRV